MEILVFSKFKHPRKSVKVIFYMKVLEDLISLKCLVVKHFETRPFKAIEMFLVWNLLSGLSKEILLMVSLLNRNIFYIYILIFYLFFCISF